MKVYGATPAAAIPAGNVIQGLPVRHVSAIGSSAILGTMIISYSLNNGKACCITM
jgi:hypothetical protein